VIKITIERDEGGGELRTRPMKAAKGKVLSLSSQRSVEISRDDSMRAWIAHIGVYP
jgi:hypothetical protein